MTILWNACLLAMFGPLMLAPFAMRRSRAVVRARQEGRS